MTSTMAVFLFPVFMMGLFQPVYEQQSLKVTQYEPGIIRLENLFHMSDTVALVRVLSGDTQNYPKVIYKAEVIRSFKGAAVGQTIYFGPYAGTRLGWEYVLFLRNVARPLAPNSPTSTANYGTVHYLEVFNQGYSSMEVSYECVFEGKDIAQQCGDGVRVCTDYITLPKSLPTSPPLTKVTDFGCRWVRKEAFLSVLDTLHEPAR